MFSPRDQFLIECDEFRTGERMKVVEWMISLVEHFELKRQTLYSAMSLFDRYCELKAPELIEMDILAHTCLFIAYKYEEIAYYYKELIGSQSY